jgi:murein L,D-transpeptidase YafK
MRKRKDGAWGRSILLLKLTTRAFAMGEAGHRHKNHAFLSSMLLFADLFIGIPKVRSATTFVRFMMRRAISGAFPLAIIMLIWLGLSGSAREPLERVSLALNEAERPDLDGLDGGLSEKRPSRGNAVFIRIFKRERELELWMKKGDEFALYKSYPICRYSGALGPKLREGDYQAPEGFYMVSREQLFLSDSSRRAFNLAFPNLYDSANGRTGSLLMVHGGCNSTGCFAMTDDVFDEIWDLIIAAFQGGQSAFAVHIFPFRMTEAKFTLLGKGKWNGFWGDLKNAYQLFEASHRPPKISFCANHYVVEPGEDGSLGEDRLSERCPTETEGQSPEAGQIAAD